MASFEQYLAGFRLAAEVSKYASPLVMEWQHGQKLDAITQSIQIAGASVASSMKDPVMAAEAQITTDLALTFAGLFTNIWHSVHQKLHPGAAPVDANAPVAAQPVAVPQ